MLVLVRLPQPQGGSKVVSMEQEDHHLVWHLKCALFPLSNIPPNKQTLFFHDKELENQGRLKTLLSGAGAKPLLTLRSKVDPKRKASRKNKNKLIRGKRFRETVQPSLCFAAGRGTSRAVVGIPSQTMVQAVSVEFQPLLSKDGRMFEGFVRLQGVDTENTVEAVAFELQQERSLATATWTPQCKGTYALHIRVLTSDGPREVEGSPFSVTVIDHEFKGEVVRSMIRDKDWNVEAGQIIAEWASQEALHATILQQVGLSHLFELLVMEPQNLIQPVLSLAMSRLLQTDSTKAVILQQGGITGLSAILSLNTHSQNTVISRFVSRSFATLGQLVATFHGTGVQESEECKQLFHLCNVHFFDMIGKLLDTEDTETIRNCARVLACFSQREHYLGRIVEAGIFPQVVELFENIENEMSIRRYGLSTLANFTVVPSYCAKYFTEGRVAPIAKVLSHPFTEDILVSDAIRALANLCQHSLFADSLVSTYPTVVEAVLQLCAGSDSLTTWEVEACLALLPKNIDKSGFHHDYIQQYKRNDSFNFESVRLLSNLLNNAQKEAVSLITKVTKSNIIPNLVHFIKSLNLGLQYVACKVIAALSVNESCRQTVIQCGGLSALCSALNTCSKRATAYIVAALAQMPLDVKGVLLHIIGDSGIEKLIALLKQPENQNLQKDTAILLASLAGSEENRKIVNQGGAAFLRSLIDLVQKGKVNVETRISPQELVYDKVIGQGISGTVWKATWKSQVVAVKKFNEDSIAFSFEEFKSETALMSVLRHQNIVHCIGSCTEPENLYIVSELFERGCVQDLIEEHSYPLSTPLALHLALGAARGMKYLHTLGIIHRDLKNGNLLLSNDWTAKVADFGLSRMTDNQMTRGVGTPIYTAPEALAGSDYSQKADVYSFAFVLWELITQQLPFADMAPFDAARRAADEGLRPPIPDNCVVEALITSCWNANPDLRPDFTEIVDVLTEIVALVGPPSELSNVPCEEEDNEDIQYNYSEANIIVSRTLRLRKKGNRSTPSSESAFTPTATPTQEGEPAGASASPDAPTRRATSKKEGRLREEGKKKRRNSHNREGGSRIRIRRGKADHMSIRHADWGDSPHSDGTPPSSPTVPFSEPIPTDWSMDGSSPSPARPASSQSSDGRESPSLERAASPSPVGEFRSRRDTDSPPPVAAGGEYLTATSQTASTMPSPHFQTTVNPGTPPTPPHSMATHDSAGSRASRSMATTQPVKMASCDHCGQVITGRSITVSDAPWHAECFQCTQCHKSLLGQAWCKHEGLPFCRTDYQALFAPRCARCQKVLESKYINALNKDWHKECFVCTACGSSLGKFEAVDGLPYCSSCAITHRK